MGGSWVCVQVLIHGIMKRLLYCMISLLAVFCAQIDVASADNDNSEKTLCFAYIAHSEVSTVNEIVSYLDSRFAKAEMDEDFVLVIYLANGEDPLVVEVNTADDNRKAYAGLIEEFKGKRSHRVDPEHDIDRIVALFDKLDMMAPKSDGLSYGAVDWHFHVNSDFWSMGYNQSLISRLCFVMGIDYMEGENFRLRCYFSRYDEPEIDPTYPFGRMNYCDMDFKPYYY